MGSCYSSRMEMPKWISFFLEFIVADGLNEDTAESFLLYLADLGALVLVDENIWSWKDCNSAIDTENLIPLVKNELELLSDTEPGFALAYFIGFKDLNRKAFFNLTENTRLKNNNKIRLDLSGKPTSNLSNLQIVKKFGNQLQPFLQVEESVVSRLIGKYVDKQKAQKLFHYMFSKAGTKAEPRAWEQLSRKRHR